MTKRPKSAVFVIERAGAGFPDKSWWIQRLSREDFQRRAEIEIPRMKTSKFSRVSASEGWAQ